MRIVLVVRYLAFVAALGAVTCGGSGGYNPSPSPTPSPSPSPGTPGQVTIVGQQAANSFNPNPGSPSTSGSVVWNNSDNVAHRIVANDGSFDSGNIAPGASSAAIAIPGDGIRYHCSIHPSMIGGIKSTSGGAPPPCTGPYC
jgi:plastocyanin